MSRPSNALDSPSLRSDLVNVSEQLLEILVCPRCKGKLDYHVAAAELLCTACRLAYPVREGIPIMLTDEARHLPS